MAYHHLKIMLRLEVVVERVHKDLHGG